MKKALFTSLLLLVSLLAAAQEKVYDAPEVVAEFPGGTSALWKFIVNNVKYPEDCRKENKGGRVVVMFVVDDEGNVSLPEIIKSPDSRLSKEVMRVMLMMPRWKPAQDKGVNVSMRFTIPVTFNAKQPKRSKDAGNIYSEYAKKDNNGTDNPRGLFHLMRTLYEGSTSNYQDDNQYKYCTDSATLQLNVYMGDNATGSILDYHVLLSDNDHAPFNYTGMNADKKTKIFNSNKDGFTMMWYHPEKDQSPYPVQQYVTELYETCNDSLPLLRKIISMIERKSGGKNKFAGCWYRLGAIKTIEGMDLLIEGHQKLYQIFDDTHYLHIYDLEREPDSKFYCILRDVTYVSDNEIVQYGSSNKITWVSDNCFKLTFKRSDGVPVTEVWCRSGLPSVIQHAVGTHEPIIDVKTPLPNYFCQ
ncbi:MAG: energy transducer TonB [Prevotella sp.]